jgi:SAM-dependent methyltransferase
MPPQSKAELLQIANARLHPSLTDPNYLVLRRRRLLLAEWIKHLPNNLTVLDLGGRYQPYRPLLEGRVRQYVAFDLLQTVITDVVGRGEALPFRNESFDLVIATGVFEYFAEPHLVAAQVHEILKPGGVLMMSVGAVSGRYVEEEHWRFMRAGLQSVLSPFSEVEIVPEVYTLGGFCRIVNFALDLMTKTAPLRAIYRATVCPCINLVGVVLEAANLSTNDQLAGNYAAWARK